MAEIITRPPQMYLEFCEPKTLEKDETTLRFTLIVGVNNEPWMTLEGWRVTRRRLVPPSRKTPSGYIPMAVLEGADSKNVMKILQTQWGEMFPKVLWPLDLEKGE